MVSEGDTQWHAEEIRGTQDALRGNQRHSDALRGTLGDLASNVPVDGGAVDERWELAAA